MVFWLTITRNGSLWDVRVDHEEGTWRLQEHAIVERYGVQVRILGELALLPKAVQKAAREVMEASKHHTKLILNICLAYS